MPCAVHTLIDRGKCSVGTALDDEVMRRHLLIGKNEIIVGRTADGHELFVGRFVPYELAIPLDYDSEHSVIIGLWCLRYNPGSSKGGWMSRLSVLIMTVLMLAASAAPACAQILTCSDAGSGECHFVHYHVQSYNDATRNFVELYGTNRFATTELCEAERTRRMDVEKQLVSYVLKLAPRARVKESNFGPCHCDMTSDPASRYFLDDRSRFERMHLQRSISLQLLEEAFDKGLPTDSPLALGLSSPPTNWVASLWPAVAEIPDDSPDRFLSTEPPTPKKTEVTAVQNSQLDADRYELVEIAFDSRIPLETVIIGDEGSGVEPAADFVNSEIAAVQARIPAVLDMEEGPRKAHLLDLVQQRLQLLSNLSRLVQTAGPSSSLARRNRRCAGRERETGADRQNLRACGRGTLVSREA